MFLIFAATALAITAVALQQSEPELPDEACIQSAQAIAADLKPYAEAVAGQSLAIEVLGGVPPILSRMVEERGGMRVVAQINAHRQIVIYPIFCPGPAGFKEAMMAHEIGHLIDFSINPEPVFWRSWRHALEPWETRPMEIKANGYADQTIRLKRGEK